MNFKIIALLLIVAIAFASFVDCMPDPGKKYGGSSHAPYYKEEEAKNQENEDGNKAELPSTDDSPKPSSTKTESVVAKATDDVQESRALLGPKTTMKDMDPETLYFGLLNSPALASPWKSSENPFLGQNGGYNPLSSFGAQQQEQDNADGIDANKDVDEQIRLFHEVAGAIMKDEDGDDENIDDDDGDNNDDVPYPSYPSHAADGSSRPSEIPSRNDGRGPHRVRHSHQRPSAPPSSAESAESSADDASGPGDGFDEFENDEGPEVGHRRPGGTATRHRAHSQNNNRHQHRGPSPYFDDDQTGDGETGFPGENDGHLTYSVVYSGRRQHVPFDDELFFRDVDEPTAPLLSPADPNGFEEQGKVVTADDDPALQPADGVAGDYPTYDGRFVDDIEAEDEDGGGGGGKRGVRGATNVFHYKVDDGGDDPSGVGSFVDDYITDAMDPGEYPPDGDHHHFHRHTHKHHTMKQ